MSVTLEDIQNLSFEVKALVDAGLPLETNLAHAGSGHGHRLQDLTESLSNSLSKGDSLDDAIRNSKSGAPRMLAAAVAAGIRSGQLGASIEMLGDMADDIVDLRRNILQSISYPIIVIAMALTMFVVFIRTFLARVRWVMRDVEIDSSPLLAWLIDLDAEYWWWPLLFPVFFAVLGVFWFTSGRAESLSFQGPERLLFLLPGVGGMIRDLQFFNLSRMLSMLVERQVPLDESLLLAGACCGSESLDAACRQAVQQVRNGTLPTSGKDAEWMPGQIPPLLQACLRRPPHEAEFQQRLVSVAGYYRRRLQISMSWLRNIVPVAMFIILGGGTVLLYALIVFWPVVEVYRFLTPN